MEPPQNPEKRSYGGVLSVLIGIVVLIVIILAVPNFSNYLSMLNPGGSSIGQNTSIYQVGSVNGSISQNPSIFNSTLPIAYPTNYSTLSNFSLSLINKDRTSYGLSTVTISGIPSGQQHADSMLKYGYFSHWDTQGLKPYMRYSMLGGSGYMEENVAYEFTTLPTYFSVKSVENALTNLEYQMMNNDSICCQNGHRNNILDQFHNEVSIGIAYNTTDVFLVEDFITNYAGIILPVVSGSDVVNMTGSPSQSIKPSSIQVFYDKLPHNLSPAAIAAEYNGPYDQGIFIGGVLPPCRSLLSCPSFQGAITIQASTWSVGSSNLNIVFSLGDFIGKYGSGVYTLYMIQGSGTDTEFLTSISIFVL